MRWIVAAAALLCGCTPLPRVVLTPCNPVALDTYSQRDQERLATVIDAMGEDTPERKAMEEAHRIRVELNALRKCFVTEPAR